MNGSGCPIGANSLAGGVGVTVGGNTSAFDDVDGARAGCESPHPATGAIATTIAVTTRPINLIGNLFFKPCSSPKK
jgi:hypothetical protein